MVKTRPHLRHFLQYYHGPGPGPGSCPGPGPGPEPKLVPVFGPGPGPVIFLVPVLVPVPVPVKISGPVTQCTMVTWGEGRGTQCPLTVKASLKI